MAASNPTVALLPDHDSLAKDPKAVDDYSTQVDAVFEKITHILLSNPENLEEVTELILVVEKKARQACDGVSVSRLCCKLLELQKDAGRWDSVNELIVTLSKKRGQLKRVITDMIHLGMEWVSAFCDNHDLKMKLIRVLASVAEGKIFVEVEKARLVRLEAQMLEDDGKVDEAALLLQEVQVETFGAMERRERSLYILDQMRLVLLRKDYVRCQIISKKINPKLLEPEEFQDIKLKYYNYLVDYHLHEKDYLNVAKDYFNQFNTPCIMDDAESWIKFLTSYVIYLIMAPHSEENLKLLQELRETETKKLKAIPFVNNLVSDFLSTELVNWPLSYELSVKSHEAFCTDIEDWQRFRSRFMQHNILVLSRYYSRISTSRVSDLLCISLKEAEQRIAELVNEDIIYARIDRLKGIVVFGKPLNNCAKLDAWTTDISKLLDLVQETTHLISNDRMVHAAVQKRRQIAEKS